QQISLSQIRTNDQRTLLSFFSPVFSDHLARDPYKRLESFSATALLNSSENSGAVVLRAFAEPGARFRGLLGASPATGSEQAHSETPGDAALNQRPGGCWLGEAGPPAQREPAFCTYRLHDAEVDESRRYPPASGNFVHFENASLTTRSFSIL